MSSRAIFLQIFRKNIYISCRYFFPQLLSWNGSVSVSRAHVWQTMRPGGIWFLLHRSGPLHLWSWGCQVWTCKCPHYCHLLKSLSIWMMYLYISLSIGRVWRLSRDPSLRTGPLLGLALVLWTFLKVPILSSASITSPTLWSMTLSSDMNLRWLPLQYNTSIDIWLEQLCKGMFHQPWVKG